jgi:hypothetical protein
MAPRLAILAWAFLLPYPLSAQEGSLAPKGFPPHVGIGKTASEDGKALIELTTASFLPETQTTMVMREGKRVQEVTTRYRTLIETSRFFVHEKDAITFDRDGKSIKSVTITGLEGVKVHYKSGKAVPRDELPKLFARARPVVVFGSDEADPYYLQVLRDDVLILTGAGNLVFPRNEHPPGER